MLLNIEQFRNAVVDVKDKKITELQEQQEFIANELSQISQEFSGSEPGFAWDKRMFLLKSKEDFYKKLQTTIRGDISDYSFNFEDILEYASGNYEQFLKKASDRQKDEYGSSYVQSILEDPKRAKMYLEYIETATFDKSNALSSEEIEQLTQNFKEKHLRNQDIFVKGDVITEDQLSELNGQASSLFKEFLTTNSASNRRDYGPYYTEYLLKNTENLLSFSEFYNESQDFYFYINASELTKQQEEDMRRYEIRMEQKELKEKLNSVSPLQQKLLIAKHKAKKFVQKEEKQEQLQHEDLLFSSNNKQNKKSSGLFK